MKPVFWIAAVCAALAGSTASAETGKAAIHGLDDDSEVSGSAELTTSTEGLRISAKVSGVPPGKHGFHIHQFGSCEDAGNAAGGHFNPDKVPHGLVTKESVRAVHPGDLGNIEVDADGRGTLNAVVPELTLSAGKYSVAGRALILHAQPDDFGQPTGNAGGRIGCGPIIITGD